MITLTREEAQQVLDALEEVNSKGYQSCWKGAFNPEIKLLRDRLAHPEPEPAAWASENVIPLRGLADNHACLLTPFKCAANTVPLYTAPPQREWQGLTDEEAKKVANSVEYNPLAMTVYEYRVAVQKATEAKLKEKNNG